MKYVPEDREILLLDGVAEASLVLVTFRVLVVQVDVEADMFSEVFSPLT